MTESMRDYQRTKGKYILPREVYHQTIWIIRDYPRMKEDADAILVESPGPSDGLPRGKGGTSDPNAGKAIRREELLAKIRVIDRELARIPREYRKAIWQSIMYRTPYPMDAERSTYGHIKSMFIYRVAAGLHLI